VISAPKDSDWGRRAVVADPDGHRIELLEKNGV
jgi:predicted enzyme related to lactoylglutathione lyase